MPGQGQPATVGHGVSIIIPVYKSQATLADCLRALERQTVQDFELILIDSSPDDACETIIREMPPGIVYEHVQRRMLPHEARNHGVERASGSILIFSDPDVYPHPEWLKCMLAVHAMSDGVVIGSVECHGAGWLATGIHLAKFDFFLPGGAVRPLSIAPTLNMLCPRAIFDALGGFAGEHMIGDTIFSWDLSDRGVPITFSPDAIVAHHHTSTWRSLLYERHARGREFGHLRAVRFRWSRGRIAWQLLITLLPVRWLNLMRRTLGASLAAGMGGRFLLTSPVVMSGHFAWLLGEARGLLDAL